MNWWYIAGGIGIAMAAYAYGKSKSKRAMCPQQRERVERMTRQKYEDL